MTSLRKAPFSPDEVQAINEYQTGTAHDLPLPPITCAKRANRGHGWEGGDRGVLIATEEGLVCPTCKYTQDSVYPWAVDQNRNFPAPPLMSRSDAEFRQAIDDRLAAYAKLALKKPEAPGLAVMINCLKARQATASPHIDQ